MIDESKNADPPNEQPDAAEDHELEELVREERARPPTPEAAAVVLGWRRLQLAAQLSKSRGPS